MDFEAFKTWRLTDLTPKVKKRPGLVKYHINLCTTLDQTFNGLAEVLIKTRAEMDAVFVTPEGQYARDGATSTASNIAILLTEKHIIVEESQPLPVIRRILEHLRLWKQRTAARRSHWSLASSRVRPREPKGHSCLSCLNEDCIA